MTNYEKWLSLTQFLPSPDNYIRWSWLFLIGSSLQRRVWIGPHHMPRFPNMYIILVGKPGIGKGVVIKPVAEILKYHKLNDPTNVKFENVESVEDKQLLKESFLNDFKMAQEAEGNKKATYEKPLLLPVAPDATTYEALVQTMAKSIRRINYKEWDEKAQKDVVKIYTHSSMMFSLEEISSLFRRHTEDTVNFLMQAYDCGDYTKETKTSGVDRVRKCCLSILGGTTPGFMQDTFSDKLLNEGFSSRTFFIFAEKNRTKRFFPPELTEEQKQHKQDIIDHVLKLSKLYGRVRVTEEAENFMQDWINNYQKSNESPLLEPFFARMDNHVSKVAMARHFSESDSMEIGLECFMGAIEEIQEEAKKMHLALGIDTSNPLAKPTKKIYGYICNNREGVSKKKLLMEFWGSVPTGMDGIDQAIDYLLQLNMITTKEGFNGQVLYIPIKESE